jgi:hypothetical protein
MHIAEGRQSAATIFKLRLMGHCDRIITTAEIIIYELSMLNIIIEKSMILFNGDHLAYYALPKPYGIVLNPLTLN